MRALGKLGIIFSLTVFCVAGQSGSAQAKSTLNRDTARECYLATLHDPSPDNNRLGIASCNEALDNSDDDTYMRAGLLTNRSYLRLRMEDYRGAVADADAGIALQADLGPAYLNRGAGLIGLSRYRDALPALEKAIALDAEQLELAYFNRGLAREQLGDIAGAYYDYKKASDLNPAFERAKEQLSRFTLVTSPAPR